MALSMFIVKHCLLLLVSLLRLILSLMELTPLITLITYLFNKSN